MNDLEAKINDWTIVYELDLTNDKLNYLQEE